VALFGFSIGFLDDGRPLFGAFSVDPRFGVFSRRSFCFPAAALVAGPALSDNGCSAAAVSNPVRSI
jgi:hypothetical protein